MKIDSELKNLMTFNDAGFKFWIKLNNAPIEIYLRFQRMFARKNNGKWIRGWDCMNETFVIE